MSTVWVKANRIQPATVDVPTSKSICNRLLILQKLIGTNLELKELSTADDSLLMQQALLQTHGTIDLKNAGTCMRFLTAYFAVTPDTNVLLDGSERMRERPIKPLVDALQQLGADITYTNKEGYPPIAIKGKKLRGGNLTVDASVSSQFTSAILLIAPWLNEKLTIQWSDTVVSSSYIYMTIKLLEQCGAKIHVNEKSITIEPGLHEQEQSITIEKDWSSAAFWFGAVAIQQHSLVINDIHLSGIQGDEKIVEFMRAFGVQTQPTPTGLVLSYSPTNDTAPLTFDMNSCPDIVPVMAVVACVQQRSVVFENVAHLQAKESNRLDALCEELTKCGFTIWHNTNQLHIEPSSVSKNSTSILLRSYNDHRLAMAFSLLALVRNEVGITDAACVEKSYPTWWDEYQKLGVEIRTATE